MPREIEKRIAQLEQQHRSPLDVRKAACYHDLNVLPASLHEQRVNDFYHSCTLAELMTLVGLPGEDPHNPETMSRLMAIAASQDATPL